MNEKSVLFEQSPYYQKLIERSLRYLASGFPIHFNGPTGIGKTTIARHIAHKRGCPVTLLHGHKDLSTEDLLGDFTGYKRKKLHDNFVRTVHKLEEKVTESWADGRLLTAVKNGHTLVYDEFTRSPAEINNLFLPILEEKRLPLYGTKRNQSNMKVHPDFSVIFTSNPLEYAGVYQTQDALLDRMITFPLEQMGLDAEVDAVINKTAIDKEKAEAIVSFITKLRSLPLVKEKCHCLSLRASLMIAGMVEQYDIPVNGKNEDFFQLCMDVTWYPLQECAEEKQKARLKRQLEEACKNIAVEDKQ